MPKNQKSGLNTDKPTTAQYQIMEDLYTLWVVMLL